MTTVINAEHKVLGRLASKVATSLMDGEEIKVINSDQILVTGKEEDIINRYKSKKDRGDKYHGPYFPRRPEKIFQRTVKGMIPDKKKNGRKALKRLKVYQGKPDEIKEEEIKSFAESDRVNPNKTECMTLQDIASYL